MILAIPPYPAEALRKESRVLSEQDFGPEFDQFVEDMIETMYDSQGVGLAAPQVGRNIRMFVFDISPERDQPQVAINPQLKISGPIEIMEEGCLSLPELRGKVKRPAQVQMQALDQHGNSYLIEAEHLAARVMQHENDHLDGILFCDRLSAAKRLMLRRYMKNLERNALQASGDS